MNAKFLTDILDLFLLSAPAWSYYVEGGRVHDDSGQVNVVNTTSSSVNWTVPLQIEGAVRNLWNAVWEQNGNNVIAEEVSWNNRSSRGEQ